MVILPIGKFSPVFSLVCCLLTLCSLFSLSCSQSAKMVVEAAVTLVQETMQLPNCFGVVTPAAGLGVAYRNRLQQHGIQFHMNY